MEAVYKGRLDDELTVLVDVGKRAIEAANGTTNILEIGRELTSKKLDYVALLTTAALSSTIA
jgi:hypothetical protein